jgi:ubiquitin-protein ligase
MALQAFKDQIIRRFGRDSRDPASSSADSMNRQTAKVSTINSGTTITMGAPNDDFSPGHRQRIDDDLANNRRAKDSAAHNQNDEKRKLRPRSPNDSIEKGRDCQDLEVINILSPNNPAVVVQRRTMSRKIMSRQKFEAMSASIARKARNELEENRRKVYAKALGQLRMTLVDCKNFDTDHESFQEDFAKFLDDEQKEKERKERELDHHWYHSFMETNMSTKKKKRRKQTDEHQDNISSSTQSPHSFSHTDLNIVQKLYRQYDSFVKNLPVSSGGSIFVRVPDDRMDLPRILITGPHGTPYANGLFFFDLCTKDYPHAPPMVEFLTTGMGDVMFNPNLYPSGKVHLSLLGTWEGPGWIRGRSTLLQVLLSIQGLILGTEEPFYNEAGYKNYKGRPEYQRESNSYNKEIRRQTLRWAILDPLSQLVIQEETADARKEFLEKLKAQQQRQSRILAASDEDEGDDIPSSDKKDEIGSKKKNKSKKWRPISKLWSSAPSSGDDESILLPSNMPPRRTCFYPEFTTVLMRHFFTTADQLDEQLQAWNQFDPKGTNRLVEEIREWMKRLMDLVESRCPKDYTA